MYTQSEVAIRNHAFSIALYAVLDDAENTYTPRQYRERGFESQTSFRNPARCIALACTCLLAIRVSSLWVKYNFNYYFGRGPEPRNKLEAFNTNSLKPLSERKYERCNEEYTNMRMAHSLIELRELTQNTA